LREDSIKEKKGEHPFGDAGQLILFGLFLVVWVADSFFLHRSTFCSHHLPLVIRLIVLILTFTIAILLFRSGHVVVSQKQRPTRVVDGGAFRYVRHPLYLASLLGYFGLTVSTASLYSFILLVGMFFFYNYIASYEEKLMEIKFGEEYISYKKRTGKWIPNFVKGH
jgi:protein-S-isoprenylcysteine O-methyltransferase Ste14